MSDLQIVADYRERKLGEHIKPIGVLLAVEHTAECHAALKSFVAMRSATNTHARRAVRRMQGTAAVNPSGHGPRAA